MSHLLTLVKMQLKEQLNFKRLELKNISFFHVLLSTVATILKFAMVVVLCAAFLTVAKMLNIFSMAGIVPPTVISMVFTLMLTASIVSCTVGLTKAMYFSHDNAILLTLPCQPVQVYFSKLIIFFIFELKRNLSFMVPLFIAYFFTHGYPLGSYAWMLLCFVIVSLFTVAVGALLSIPGMMLATLFRHHKWLQITCLIGVVASASVALFFAISVIPEDINLIETWGTTFWQIQDVLAAYRENFAIFYDASLLILGEMRNMAVSYPVALTAVRFAKILLPTAVLLVTGLLIVRPLFYKMASKPFEHVKKKVAPKKNRVLPRPISALWVESLRAIRGASRLFANVGVLIALPMLIFLLNKIFLAMNTREAGDFMVVAFNVLIILLIALNSNFYISSIYSRDGRSAYLIKVQPARYWPLLIAKLFPNVLFLTLAMLATFVILLSTASLGFLPTALLMLGLFAVYLSHLLYCAEMDLMNPQIELYATVGGSENNANENRATLTAFLCSFIVAGVLFYLMWERRSTMTVVFVKLLVVAGLVLLYRLRMFFSKIKLYYKEK